MCTKPSATSNLNCSKKNMKKFFNNKNWKEKPGNTLPTMDGIKQELENMEPGELKAFKLKTQTNLAKATLQNRNNIVEHGVPIVSIILSILAIILSIRPIKPITYSISGQKIEPEITGDNSNIFWAVVILVGLAIIIVGMFCYSAYLQRKHKYEIFYYQTMLNIITAIEKEREHSNHYDVSVHNTETGETKQYDAYLLQKKQINTRKDTTHEKTVQPHSLSLHAVGCDADIRVRIRKHRHRRWHHAKGCFTLCWL